MKKEDFKQLKSGDIVKNEGTISTYIVTGNYGDGGVTMVKTVLAFNADEWSKVITEPK